VVELRRLNSADVPRLRAFWGDRWAGDFVVAHGVVFRPEQVEGWVLEQAGEWAGLVTFVMTGQDCEIVSLDSLGESKGVGSRLLSAVLDEARRRGARAVIVTTTNDNLRALRFYQKRGFTLRTLRAGALARTRELKPSVSAMGQNGIPLRDELELVLDPLAS
jgi:GNAT superfamily N-acetyltransferase